MKLLHRFGFFSIGLIMGIILLIFFLGGKRASCNYTPNARTLEDIRFKTLVYSEETQEYLYSHNVDSIAIASILNDGDVNFGKSLTDHEPCNIYFITGEIETRKLELQIENCRDTATVQGAEFIE